MSYGEWHVVYIGADANRIEMETGDYHPVLYHPDSGPDRCHIETNQDDGSRFYGCDVQEELDNVGWMGIFPGQGWAEPVRFPDEGWYVIRLNHVTHIGWEHTEYDTEHEVVPLRPEGGYGEKTEPHPNTGAGPEELTVPEEWLPTGGTPADHLCPEGA